MKDIYTQCLLRKQLGKDRYIESRVYIPHEFAKIGQVLKVKDKDGLWDNGWTVCEIGHSIDNAIDIHKAIKTHRKNTGDSLPKGST